MQLVWTESAIADLISIREYIERDNPEAAERVAESILKSVRRLESNPMVGRIGRVSGTRELVIAKIPYICMSSKPFAPFLMCDSAVCNVVDLAL